MNIKQVSRKLREDYSDLESWSWVARVNGITKGMAWRIARKGYEPKNWNIRERLGLPLLAPAPVCLKCGQVHVTKKCMANNGNGHRPRRVAIRVDNPESAARTIEKHFGKAFIYELIELLDNRYDYY